MSQLAVRQSGSRTDFEDYVLHHGDLAIARTFGRVGVPCIRHPRGSPRAGRFVALHH